MPIKKIDIKDFEPEAMEIYRRFKSQTGSEHIAKPVTIQMLMDICRKEKPKTILEMGGGLGTISYTILKYSEADVDIYEEDEFCQGRLKEVLAPFEGRYQIIKDYRMLPPRKAYDLVIVDGASGKADDGGFRKAVWHYLHYLDSVKIVCVEGYRFIQRVWARRALRAKYVYSLTRFADMEYEGKKLMGGLRIDCRPSRSRLLRYANYWFWEFVEGHVFKYFFAYRLSVIKKKLFN